MQVANHSNYLPTSTWGKQAIQRHPVAHLSSLFKMLHCLKTCTDTYTTFAFPFNTICLKSETKSCTIKQIKPRSLLTGLPIGVFWYNFADLLDSQNKYHTVVHCKTSNFFFLFHFILDIRILELFL